ncbi:MAG: sensor histidine kinase [Candidatus Sericytochromatia bacterium]
MPHTALSSPTWLYAPAHLARWSYHLEKDQLWWSPEMYRLFDLSPDLPPSWEALEKCLAPSSRGLLQRLQNICKAGVHSSQETLERLVTGTVWLEYTAFLETTGVVVGCFKELAEQAPGWRQQMLYQEQLNQLAYRIDLPTETLLQEGLTLLLRACHGTAAHIVKIRGEMVEIVSHVDQRQQPEPPLLRPGQRMDLKNGVLEKASEREGVFSEAELNLEPVLKKRLARYGFSHFLGCRFSLQQQVAGTLVYFAEKGRQRFFSEAQRQFLARFSQWVGFVLERNQSLADLEQLSLKKDRLLATVAHDLREPLHIVVQSSQLLKKEAGALASEQHQIWEMLDKACRHADGLINELLEVAELERNPRALTFEHTDLLPLLQDTLAAFQKRARSKAIELNLQASERLPQLALNTLKIRRVFDNLLNNALKFTPQGGRITLMLRREADYARLEIADTGIGIPAENRSHLFEPFSKARRKGLNGEPSTGLGMYIVQEIVRLHGGQITVSSEVGQGTQFTIYLPLLQTP